MKRIVFVLLLAVLALVRCGKQSHGEIENQNRNMLGAVKEAHAFSEASLKEMREEADRLAKTGLAKHREDAAVLAEAAPKYEALTRDTKLYSLIPHYKDSPGKSLIKRQRLIKIGQRYRDLLNKTKPAYQSLYNAAYLSVGEVEAKKGSAYRMLEAHDKLLKKLDVVPK